MGGSAAGSRSLCTPAELKLLACAEASRLARATPAAVKATLARARETRDKWRSLAARQDRSAKRTPPSVAAANARSREKASLFDGAVKRLEMHLAKVDHDAPKNTQATPRKTSKRVRVAGNRQSRAEVRSALTRKAAVINDAVARRAGSADVPASPQAAAGRGHAAVVPAGQGTARTRQAAAAAQGTRRPTAHTTSATRSDAAQQRAVRTGAKQSRLKASGLTTRLRSHTKAAGKRAQGRRDGRR